MESKASTTIVYRTDSKGLTPAMFTDFFEGWTKPLTPEQHLRVLENSQAVVVAIDPTEERVVGFITALTDYVLAAFIPLLEVVPSHRGRGIGSRLVSRMLEKLDGIQCVDLTCDPSLQSFYLRFGMQPSVGMIIRNYE